MPIPQPRSASTARRRRRVVSGTSGQHPGTDLSPAARSAARHPTKAAKPPEPADQAPPRPARVVVGGMSVDSITEAELVETVVHGWRSGAGGLIVTPNVDIWRLTRRDRECADLVAGADVVVADGQPLLWAAKLAGTPLRERVTGADLVESLSAAAAREQRSVYIVGGGADDVGERAAESLASRHSGLRIAGHVVPPYGFEQSAFLLRRLVESIVEADPHLVLVGLGFPKQERLATLLREHLPRTWFLGCGGGVAIAGGMQRRAPMWAQDRGLEWLVRLAQEPRRLARRYLVDDAPAALYLLSSSLSSRVTWRQRSKS